MDDFDCFGDDVPAVNEPPVAHVRAGNRVSLLPITKYCGQAGRLSQLSGSGRAAVMSQWFHAHCAGKLSEADIWWSGLTLDEREEVQGWVKPTDVELDGGVLLRYSDAKKELEISLDFGLVSSLGHLDMAWGPVVVDGVKCVYVGDIKKSSWTTLDGPDSLQLHGYAMAYALLTGAEAYVTGLWIATEGEWRWATEMVMLGTEQSARIFDELSHAAGNVDGEYSMGVHCGDCYGRMKCPQYTLAALQSPGWLEPMIEGKDLSEIDDATLVRMLIAAKQTKEIGERVIKNVNALVDRGRRLADENSGKVYATVVCKGRESVSVKDLRDRMGAEADLYVKRGNSFSQHRWLKP